MSFDSWGEFFAMGGHGFYVWLSYALSAAVVLGNVLMTRGSRRRYILEQQDLELRLKLDKEKRT